MKIKNQWIVNYKYHDKLLVETESGLFYIQNREHSFDEISSNEALSLINF